MTTSPSAPIPPFALERYFARWEFKAPYLLCASDIEAWRLGDLLALADDETRNLWDALTLGYTETAGHPLLLREIATLYETLGAGDIRTFAGAEEAVYVAMRVLVRPGDHVLCTWPGYQSLYQIAASLGAEVERLLLEQTGAGWSLDIDAVRRAVRPTTRLIITNFPHNPTGALPAHADWQALIKVARDAGVWLFSDEVYRFSEYDPSDRLPAAADHYERAISLGVMSKSFALAGLRIGWLATRDRGFLDAAITYKDYTSLCNSAPSEILALIALRARQRVLERNLSLLRANLARVDAFMAEHADVFDWIPPAAGSIAFPRLVRDEPIEAFVEALAQEQGVLLLPASVYDYPGNHFRLGMGRANLPEALARVGDFVRQRR